MFPIPAGEPLSACFYYTPYVGQMHEKFWDSPKIFVSNEKTADRRGNWKKKPHFCVVFRPVNVA
jgi:hypothetical protein